VRGYARGETPNPCIRCNGGFRFAQLLAFAKRAGAARLATGHYARIVERDGTLLLAKAADERKDQSYMLATVDRRFLDRLWFPLGEHDGHWAFTPGQRRGLRISASQPLYAIDTDAATNTVVAGPRAALARTQVSARGRLFTSAGRVDAKLRYRSPAVAATVEPTEAGFSLRLDEPAFGVARGQAAVLYDGDVVVGSGLVTSAGSD
jgi:tRNA-specific 2-thiouridylase